jgi:hypothetical protein
MMTNLLLQSSVECAILYAVDMQRMKGSAMETQLFQSGDKATWLHYHRFRNSSRCYRATVRILDIRKHTARIETQRYDGTIKRRFVKLSQLYPGVR